MSVEMLYFSSKDGREKALSDPENLMFTSKKAADERDRALDFAMNFATYMKSQVSTDDADLLEEIGLKIAENPKLFAQALKKPEVLVESGDESAGSDEQQAGTTE